MDYLRELFELTAAIAADFYETLPDRPVYPRATVAELHAALSAPLPEHGLVHPVAVHSAAPEGGKQRRMDVDDAVAIAGPAHSATWTRW